MSRIMHGGSEPTDFKPPPPGRWSMPMTLAVLVHGALIVALAWGVNWNKETEPMAFEAELWSALPREAAPRAVQPPPPPPPEPAPPPEPVPVTAPPPPPAPAPAPTVRDPDIATQQAKKKADEDRRVREEAARKAREAEQKRKAEAERKKAEQIKKAEAAKAAADKRRREAQAKAERERREAEAVRQAREDQMRRIMGQAGATGAPDARGTATRSSGPSAGYAARVAARIRPNIVYTEEFPARLATEIEVRAAPDGNILSRRVVRSSGNSAWDEAAVRAIDRTGSLPRDTDGRVPSPLVLVLRPLD